MSDPMMQIKQNQSIFNPTDNAMMAQQGEISQDMTVREYLAKVGVDVEGPVSQLVEMAKGQMQKGNPMNKMKAMAGGSPQGQPSPMPQGPGPQQQPGMAGLLKTM